MIVKVKTYKRMGAARGLLQYVLNDRKRLFDRKGKSFVLTQNLKGQDIDEWVREFKENEKFRKHRRSNNVQVTQEILSFHRGDSQNISLKKLQDIAKKYMEMRRGDKAMYVAVPHFDKHHWHIHIICAAVEYRTGKAMRMSRGEFTEIKHGLQAYQIEKYPELSRSVVRHGRGKNARITDREYRMKERTRKPSKRDEIAQTLRECQARANTQQAFIAEVEKAGLSVYIRGGRPYGVEVGKQRFRFRSFGIELESLSSATPERTWRTRNQRISRNRSITT